MEYAVLAALAIVAVLFVSRPLFARRGDSRDVEDVLGCDEGSEPNRLRQRKARVEENLSELEFEYRTGKLSDADYTALHEAYGKEIEDLSRSSRADERNKEIEDFIAREVRARRRTK